ncbi:hypothetical protein pipiens_004501, partial [Culex pipiens pipiens]
KAVENINKSIAPAIMRPVGCDPVASHAGNKLQEFMLVPTGASFEAMKIGTEEYHPLKNVIKAKFGLDATTVGDEDAIAKAGYTGKVEISGRLHSEFHKDWLSSDFLEDMYHCFIKDFPIVSLEDPFHQDHWNAWAKITANIRHTTIQIENAECVRINAHQWVNVKRESVIEDAQTMTVNKTQKSKDNVEQTRVNRAGNNNRLKERKRLSNELAFSQGKDDEQLTTKPQEKERNTGRHLTNSE